MEKRTEYTLIREGLVTGPVTNGYNMAGFYAFDKDGSGMTICQLTGECCRSFEENPLHDCRHCNIPIIASNIREVHAINKLADAIKGLRGI